MNIQWEKIRHSSNPTSDFREELRATLYENATAEAKIQLEKRIQKIALPSSHLELSFTRREKQSSQTIWETFFTYIHSFRRWMFLAGGGALAMLIMIPMFSIFVSAPLSASTKSYIYSVSGDAALERSKESSPLESNQEIFPGDIISTNKHSSLEILFFEGTSLRLDRNTSIQIGELSPEKGIFTKGGVAIELIEGRIWSQNFHTPDTHSALSIQTNHTTTFPIRANLDIAYQGGKEHIRVFENSALVHVEGISLDSEILLSPEEELFFTPFDTEITPLTMTPQSSLWKIRNHNRSNQYKKEYLQNISNTMKEAFVIDEITSQIHTFIAQDPSPEEMEKMIEKMNILMDTSAEPSLTTERQEILLPFFEKEQTETIAQQKKEEETPAALTQVSPHAHYQAPQKTYTPPQKQIIHTSPAPRINTIPLPQTTPETAKTIQEQKKEEKIPDTTESTPPVKTAKQILAERRIEKFHKASQNFTEQIETLSLRDSRRNHAQNILHKIPDTPENIELLDIMMQDAPTDVQRYIQAKKTKIIRSTPSAKTTAEK